jgi:hypothetical protein
MLKKFLCRVVSIINMIFPKTLVSRDYLKGKSNRNTEWIYNIPVNIYTYPSAPKKKFSIEKIPSVDILRNEIYIPLQIFRLQTSRFWDNCTYFSSSANMCFHCCVIYLILVCLVDKHIIRNSVLEILNLW